MDKLLLYCEINVLCAVMLFIMAAKVSKEAFGNSAKRKVFVASIFFAAVLNLMDIVWQLGIYDVLHISHTMMHVINCVYFLCFGISSYPWLVFSEIIHKIQLYKNKLLFALSMLPLFLFVVLAGASVNTGWFFYFDAAGAYRRGPLFLLQYVLTFCYVFMAAGISLCRLFSRKVYARREDYMLMLSFVVPPIVCSVLQYLLQPLPILSASFVLGFSLVFTSSMQTEISLDALTGINNRRKVLLELENNVRSLPKGKKLYFLFLDVDDFKSINDLYGHYDGDKTLQTVADALRAVCKTTGGICGRYGGDEFVMVQQLEENDDIRIVCSLIHDKVSEFNDNSDSDYDVSVSVGYSVFGGDGDDVQSLIQRADKQMYSRKRDGSKRRK